MPFLVSGRLQCICQCGTGDIQGVICVPDLVNVVRIDLLPKVESKLKGEESIDGG